MKVRLRESVKDPWLRGGQEYVVLSLISSPRGVEFRICSGSELTPVIHSSAMFDITSDALPSGWVAYISREGGYLELSPPEWNKVGFWQKFFDGDDDSIGIFREASYGIISDQG